VPLNKEPRKRGAFCLLTRRQVVGGLAIAGAGVALSPFRISAAAAMQTENVFEPHIPTALRRALELAGEDGFVASLPQLLAARVQADYDELIWNTWFTSTTEESVVTTPQGNRVVVVVHGGGIFGSPDRFERSLNADLHRDNPEGITGQTAAKITEREAHGLLEGRLPDGTVIPVYSYDEFKSGVSDLPQRYGVVLDFELARQSKRGFEEFEILKDDPNMIARAGGVDANIAYLDKFRNRHDTNLMGHWHPYNRIDPDQPQTRIVFLAGNRGGVGSEGKNEGLGWGYDAEYGIGGDASMVGMARYLVTTSRDDPGTFVTAVPSWQEAATIADDTSEDQSAPRFVFDSYATVAQQRALNIAGTDGVVASMPQLLHARTKSSYDDLLWNTWFNANSDECVVTTPQGNKVVVTVHGGGILASPQRIERALRADLDRHNSEGLTGQYAVKISTTEAEDLLNGVLPDGSELPVFSFDDFRRGITDLPLRYAVTLDFDSAKNAVDGFESFDVLRDDPIMICRAGGPEALSAYLDKARARHNTSKMGNRHPFDRIDPDQPQARRLWLSGNQGGRGSDGSDVGLGWGYDSDYGMTSGGVMGLARYVVI